MVACLAIVGIRGLNFGIEFVGGTSVAFHGTGDVTTEQMRERLRTTRASLTPSSRPPTTGGEPGLPRAHHHHLAPRTPRPVPTRWPTALGMTAERLRGDHHRPRLGRQRHPKSSLIAFLVSILLIIVYIAIRFEYKMGVMAIVALLHDLILVVGVYALVGREVNPNTIAALLTILGYSLYDTVVVFHRINDNMKGEDIQLHLHDHGQPLHEPGAHPHHQHHAHLAHPGARHAAVRRRDAEGLRVRHGHRPGVRLVLVHRHRRARSYCHVEDARAAATRSWRRSTARKWACFEFDHSASTGIAQVPLARLEANARAEAYVAEQTEATGEAPDAAAVAAAAKPKPVNNKKKKHRHGRTQ